jgi:hypothetical protein
MTALVWLMLVTLMMPIIHHRRLRMVVKPFILMMLQRLPLQLVWLLSLLPLLMALLTSRIVDLVARLLPLVGTLPLRLFALRVVACLVPFQGLRPLFMNWLNPVRPTGCSQGPYLGGVQKTFKTISISLVTDGFDDFFRFYNGIITQLILSGFHCRLLPSLDRIAPDVDLCRSPVNATCMPLSGAHCLVEWSQAAYWDEQHEHLSQLLYLTLTSKDVIKTTAPIMLSIINCHSQYINGFGVLQALIRRHHPRVTLSMAPSFAQCLTLRPTLQLAKGSHPAYLSLFERWMDRIRLNLE